MEIRIKIEAEPVEIESIVAGFGNPRRNVPLDVARIRDILQTIKGITADQIAQIIQTYLVHE